MGRGGKLSHGRVDISFAVGWNPNDFLFAPQAYAERAAITFEGIEAVRRMWAGEPYAGVNGKGERVSVTVHPLPVQKVLNVWLTCSGGGSVSWRGEEAFNVLTALLFQSVEDLAEKIAAYRAARAKAGHAGPGRVTLTLHTFVGRDEKSVKETVREPFKHYLESSADLWQVVSERVSRHAAAQMADMLEYAFERYYQRTALMGARESTAKGVEACARAGADEIACLIYFGLPAKVIMEGMEWLDELRKG